MKSDDVALEERISRGRVDYSFRLNGIPKFFLEAKALKIDLDDPKFIKQAINYAWHTDLRKYMKKNFNPDKKE